MLQPTMPTPALSGTTTFTIDRDRVMYETLDDETIVIDLGTATYYSVGGCGVDIWTAVVDGAALGAVVAQLERRFPDATGLWGTVTDWVSILCQEGLVKAAGGPEGAPPGREALPEGMEIAENWETSASPQEATRQQDQDASGQAALSQPQAFQPPVLSRYTDMQALLLLDPVHEVDTASGWPSVSVDQM